MRGRRGRIAGECRFVNDSAAKGMRTYWWVEAKGEDGKWDEERSGKCKWASPEEREALDGESDPE
jgi:hypothetical protein